MTPRTLMLALALGSAISVASAPSLADAQPQSGLERTVLSAGMYKIDAQVAQTPAQLQTGLMYRREMPQAEGMLFVFDRPGVQCFWICASSAH